MTSHTRRHLAAAIAAAFGCFSVSALAATITVTNGGDFGDTTTCTLRQAIASANSDSAAGVSTCADGSGADTIQFDSSLDGKIISLGHGQLLIASDVTVTGSGQFFDTYNNSRVLEIAGPATVALSDLTLRHGNAGNGRGGALYVHGGANVTLQGVTIANSSAKTGGGIHANNSSLSLIQSTVSDNTATGVSAAIIVTGGIESISNTALTLDHVALTGNSASNNPTGTTAAGGLYDFGSAVSISDSTISGNTAATQSNQFDNSASGGVYSNHSTYFSVARSTVANNSATATPAAGSNQFVTGGIYLYRPAQVALHDVTIANNTASAHHSVAFDAVGGLRVFAASVVVPIANATISANTATGLDPGAGTVGGALIDGPIDLRNSIDSGNQGGTAADLELISTSGQVRSSLLGLALQATLQGNGNRFADDPHLQPLTDYGGATETMALLPNSLAIDAGDNTLVLPADTTDQRGRGFPRIFNGTVDMGAFEFVGSERDVLLAIYLATNGNAWTNNSKWCNGACPASGTPVFNAPGTECSWAGVACTAGQVTTLGLASNHLVGGPLPPLARLSQLTYAHLEDNAITGAIPSIAGLSQLSLFYVNNNALTGPMPSLAGLPQLLDLDVHSNQLSGTIPSLAGFVILEYADFAGNQFTGAFPDLTNTPNLTYVDVSQNQLSGTLPDLSATALQYLFVQANQFSGAVPNPPPGLAANQNALCPNRFKLSTGPHDAAWNAATGQTPWWGPAGGGCDTISDGSFELLGNASFEHGIANWHTTGACLWETAAAGTVSAGYRNFTAPAAVDGDRVLLFDSQNFAVCSIYQDVTVPSGASSANLSAAIGYYAPAPWDSRCSVDFGVVAPDGTPIASYISFTGGTSSPFTQYAPVSFGVTPGQVLRVQATVADECVGEPAGVALDNVQLTVQ